MTSVSLLSRKKCLWIYFGNKIKTFQHDWQRFFYLMTRFPGHFGQFRGFLGLFQEFPGVPRSFTDWMTFFIIILLFCRYIMSNLWPVGLELKSAARVSFSGQMTTCVIVLCFLGSQMGSLRGWMMGHGHMDGWYTHTHTHRVGAVGSATESLWRDPSFKQTLTPTHKCRCRGVNKNTHVR